jgi:hypothetical protein
MPLTNEINTLYIVIWFYFEIAKNVRALETVHCTL